MSGKFIDVLYNIVIQFKWKYVLLLFLVLFGGGWWATCYFEPKAEIIKPSIYWWYFITNVLRGGYSGYSPETLGARIVSLVSYFGGGIFFITVLCKTTLMMHEYSQKRRKGVVKVNMKDHIVILGYRAGESEKIIHQLHADHSSTSQIILCSKHLTENPLPGLVEFVKGDTASDEVMFQACLTLAKVIVISGHSDERALAIALAANAHNPRAHMVVYLENPENGRFLKMINPRIESVSSLRTMLIAQAIFNPGVTDLIKEMVSLDDPGTIYRIDIPLNALPEITFHEIVTIFHLNWRTIMIGYAASHAYEEKPVLNPEPFDKIRGGMSLFYIAEYRIDKVVDWSIVRRAPEMSDFEQVA